MFLSGWAAYAACMNVTRHFSDTRTEWGRVRFLLCSGRVRLMAEGQGWQHESSHASLHDAATFLAVVPQVNGALYNQALDDLERQLQLEELFRDAA